MADNVVSKLVENTYIHSTKWNFYKYAGVPNIKRGIEDSHQYKQINSILNNMRSLKQAAEDLENQFYADLQTVTGMTKTQFEQLVFSGKLDSSVGPTPQTVRAEALHNLNNEKLASLFIGQGQDWFKQQLVSTMQSRGIEQSLQDQFFNEVYDLYFATPQFIDKVVEFFEPLMRKNSTKTSIKKNELRAAIMDAIKQSNGNKKNKTTKTLKGIELKKKTLENLGWNVRKASKGVLLQTGRQKGYIDNELKKAYEKAYQNQGGNMKNFGTEWQEDFNNFKTSFYNTAQEVINNMDWDPSLEVLSAAWSKGIGDSLEVTLGLTFKDIQAKAGQEIEVRMIGGQKHRQKKYDTVFNGTTQTIQELKQSPGETRTDMVIILNGKKYGFQLKNTFNKTEASIHLQHSIKLNTLLTTVQEQGLISEEDKMELFYLLGNIFWFQYFPDDYSEKRFDSTKMYTHQLNEEGERKGAHYDGNTIVNYANGLLQAAINFILEPQIAGYVNDTAKEQKINQKNGVANVFFIYNKSIIPVSWFYNGVIYFLEQFIENKKKDQYRNGAIYIQKVSLQNQITDTYMSEGENPGKIYSEKHNAMNQLGEEYKYVREYPDNILSIGARIGKKFRTNAKIGNITAFIKIQELEDYYRGILK